MLVCVSVSVLFDIDVAVVCADVVPEESQCNWAYVALSVGVPVVSATPLDSRIYVTCSYVFCHVSKSFLYNSFSSSSSSAAETSGGLGVNPAASVPLVKKNKIKKTSTQTPESFRLRWVMTSGQYVPLYPFPSLESAWWVYHLQHHGIHGWWHLLTSSGNCPTDNANGLPSPRSRQKSFLGFKFKRTGLGLTGLWVGCGLDPPCRGQQIKHSRAPVRRQKERARDQHHPSRSKQPWKKQKYHKITQIKLNH